MKVEVEKLPRDPRKRGKLRSISQHSLYENSYKYEEIKVFSVSVWQNDS